MVYPKTGYDTLVYNQVKEITLDSIPQGKYTVVCGPGKNEQKMSFFIRKQKLEITKEQLKAVFENTDTATLAKVVKTINNYSNAFGINTNDRMVLF
jgi:stalled ribosome rescue protein Dom34